jgi:hypothetical protein
MELSISYKITFAGMESLLSLLQVLSLQACLVREQRETRKGVFWKWRRGLVSILNN